MKEGGQQVQPAVSYYATIKGFPPALPSTPLSWLMSGSSEGISAMQRTLHKSLSSLQRASGCMSQQQQQQQQWHSTHAPSNMRHDIAELFSPLSPTPFLSLLPLSHLSLLCPSWGSN